MKRPVIPSNVPFRVTIPTNQAFLQQWHAWVYEKVSNRFKRNQERALDVAQNVRLRLLTKDFIGRWFFKHLTDESVDRIQAERILGGTKLVFIGSIKPVSGDRSDPNSLWRVSDLLGYAKFDYTRYYYSIQGHTIDSKRVLELLGYEKDEYASLQSLYRQGRLLPSEYTEHECPGTSQCSTCDKGRESLKNRSLSLAHNWMDTKVSHSVKKLRWNDKQLRPFLREWHNSNKVKFTPEYIIRSYRNCSRCKNTRIVDHKERGEVACPKCDIGIDAGLLKYAEIVISNATRNDFKHMKRTDDISISILNNGMSPELSDSETTAWESDEIDESPQRVIRDSNSLTSFRDMEVYRDIHNLTKELDEPEKSVITNVDLKELSVKQYSEISGMSLQKINKLRNLALQKLRMMSGVNIKELVKRIANKNKCSEEDILEQSIGPGVVARAELFAALYDEGLSVEGIAKRFDVSEDRVVAAINRACIRESRSTH